MQQTAKHARPRRPGLIRRLVGGRRGGESDPSQVPDSPDILDLAEAGGPIALARIERLETGMHLMAETMKVTYGRLTAAVEDVRRQAVRGTRTNEPRRASTSTGGHLSGHEPRATEGPVTPVVPREPEGPGEPLDPLTALRRARFGELETDPAEQDPS